MRSDLIKKIENNIWHFGLEKIKNVFGNIVFSNGNICGYDCQNEVRYEVTEDCLNIIDVAGNVSSQFKFSEFREDFWSGRCLLGENHENHYLALNKNSPIELKWNDCFIEVAKKNHFYFAHCAQRENVYNQNSFLKAYPNSNVEAGATLPFGALISVGMFSYINGHNTTNMKIGRYSSIAAGLRTFGNAHPTNWISSSPVFYTEHHHEIYKQATNKNLRNLYHFEETQDSNPIFIGNDVWIGEGCIIKPGVIIGDGAIIAAHSIVTKDVPNYSLVAGVPAQVRKYRFKDSIINKLNRIQWWDYDISDLDIDWRTPEKSIDELEYRLSRSKKLDVDVRDFTHEFMKKNISVYAK